ncbi:MAG TPA: GntR family transcriptional regulator [Actinokineospora sp.]|jgi:GntR family transcriptional regulator|nr:GntR family transcriptional regulator [Actinokineospora sp.]
MAEPAYVSISGAYARRIRSGDLAPGTQLPSYAEIAKQHGVSDIVVRKAISLLLSQGLVRSARRRGIFVADRPNLVRISPERQMQSAEVSFGAETEESIVVDRETETVSATDELAETFGIAPGDQLTHVITRVSDGGNRVSISNTYRRAGTTGTANATVLEETLTDKLPSDAHAEWLGTTPGSLVKNVHQQFFAADGQVVMVSDISYPQDRYDAFVFRMDLTSSAGS